MLNAILILLAVCLFVFGIVVLINAVVSPIKYKALWITIILLGTVGQLLYYFIGSKQRTDHPPANGRYVPVSMLAGIIAVLLVPPILISSQIKSYEMDGPSMEPTYADGDRFVISKMHGKLKKGDVVLVSITNPLISSKQLLLKRIEAVGNDSIAGEKVPVGYVYVLGDNIANSLDSRSFGPVKETDIVGKVLFKY